MADRFEISAALAVPAMTRAVTIGIDPNPIARACGLDPARFSLINERVKLEPVCRFVETLATLSGDPTFGLQAATTFVKGSTGLLGYSLMHAPTFGEALDFVRRHLRKVDTGTLYALKSEGEDTRYEWTYPPFLIQRTQFVDLVSTIILSHFQSLLGSDFSQLRLEMERPRPANLQVYRRILTKRVTFDAPVNACIFPTRLLARENPNSDRRLFELLVSHVENSAEMVHPVTDPVTATHHYVAGLIGQKTPSLAEAARNFGMGERTLQRRLAEAGTSLQEIVDAVRRDLAMRLLADTDLTLSEISYRLGFSAPSAFTRSATRWFGVTPKQYRHRLK
ncbi:AraC family transcriptional regulator [Pseudohoeflea coraliihabitans]|uniref:AraC family transcriptional regulator n=1 Tax=Pseudohoeflea coraliihabitans TaxID=2860393 RepID=A0ABS6WQ55_9HYPH|nr:AraC family transcriptional regulator [Pseudohoeflea sp. DP4N28-3]MBW3097910.1 AraC family transcriptional regulator [Pseudohoeflea sp. DP4N28-3]